MAHEHPVVDADKRFLIDPITRIVKNAESKKTVLVQNDHNSERLSFELDRYVEGHDMLESTSVHIHYDNVGTNRLKNSGVYEVDDIQPSPDDSTKVVFTWLVSQHATSLVGALNFSITFECEADGVVEYRWSTVLNTNDVQISEGLDNGEAVATKYADILTKWKNELYSIVYTYPTFAEVCRWEDDNPDDENRIGYFVTVEQSDITEESLIVKAAAASEIRGVTMESPGFAANNNDYKFDDNGELLHQYDYVGFSGFIPVIDNGTCSVNGWCKPGDKGTAVPTDDNTGYRVIERVDDTHVLILVEPQGAISTLMAKDTEIIEALTEHANDKSNPHGTTAKQVGALPIIAANGASYDMNNIFTSGTHFAFYETNGDTLNTPRAAGLTTLARAKILSFAVGTTYGFQIAFPSGGRIPYMRRLNNGTIYEWGVGYTASDIGAMPNKTNEELRKSVNYIGINPITKPEDDTVANWVAVGSGWAYINASGKLANQPTQWGFVENIVADNLCYQVWHSQTITGVMYHRGGSVANGWYDEGKWLPLAEANELNIPTYTSLDQIKLTDDDFVVDDLEANLYKLHNTMPQYGELAERGSTDPLSMSIKNRLNRDLGANYTESSIIAYRYTKYGTTSTPAKLEVVHDSASTKKIYVARIDGGTSAVTIDPFIEVYNPNGFVSLDGAKPMSNNLHVDKTSNPAVSLNDTTTGTRVVVMNEGQSASLSCQEVAGDTSNLRKLYVRNAKGTYKTLAEAVQLSETIASNLKLYTIYGSHNVTAGTTDITAGTDALATDCYYDVYK